MSKQVQADTLLRDTAVNVQRDVAVNVQRDIAVNVQSDIAVNVRNITKNYEQWQRSSDRRDLFRNLIKPEKRIITALDDVSFQVEKGEFVAYAGANGAGKSTTMKILAGMLYPTSGSVSVLGLSPQTDRIPLMRRLGVMFGNRTELWWDQPVIQSFEWKRVIWDIPDDRYRKTLDTVCELLDIKDLLHTFVRELSLGQRMKADLALLLLHEPELILLDEPTIGLDVLAKRQMIGFLKDLNREKQTTILVTSHDMDDLEEMARRIILVSKGHIAYDGSFGDLRTAAGCMCRIAVTIEADFVPAELESAGVMEELGRADAESAGVALGRPDAESVGVALGRPDAESVVNGSDGRSVLAANGSAAPAVANNCAAHPADHRSAPVIPNASLISGSRGVFEYEFDQQATPITSILSSISGIPGVKDVEIKKAPIEEVITGLYLKWKGIE